MTVINSVVQKISPAKVVTLYRLNVNTVNEAGVKGVDVRFTLDKSQPYDSAADYELPNGWRITHHTLSGGANVAYFLTTHNQPISIDDIYFVTGGGGVCARVNIHLHSFKRVSAERPAIALSDVNEAMDFIDTFFSDTINKFDVKRAFLGANDTHALNTMPSKVKDLLASLKRLELAP